MRKARVVFGKVCSGSSKGKVGGGVCGAAGVCAGIAKNWGWCLRRLTRALRYWSSTPYARQIRQHRQNCVWEAGAHHEKQKKKIQSENNALYLTMNQ